MHEFAAQTQDWHLWSKKAHDNGCNAVAWAPAFATEKLLKTGGPLLPNEQRFASGGSDNSVKVCLDCQHRMKAVLEFSPVLCWMDRSLFGIAPSDDPAWKFATAGATQSYACGPTAAL